MKPPKIKPLKTDHLPLRTDTYYGTRDGNWVLLGHNSAISTHSTHYPFVVVRSSSEVYMALSYTDKGEHLCGCIAACDIIGVYGKQAKHPKITNNMPKLGRPKGSPVSEAAIAARKDNWTLHTLRAMYANAINIRDKDKDLLHLAVPAALGDAINRLAYKLHPELEELNAEDEAIVINGREWRKDKNWVWYSVRMPKEVKINCL